MKQSVSILFCVDLVNGNMLCSLIINDCVVINDVLVMPFVDVIIVRLPLPMLTLHLVDYVFQDNEWTKLQRHNKLINFTSLACSWMRIIEIFVRQEMWTNPASMPPQHEQLRCICSDLTSRHKQLIASMSTLCHGLIKVHFHLLPSMGVNRNINQLLKCSKACLLNP